MCVGRENRDRNTASFVSLTSLVPPFDAGSSLEPRLRSHPHAIDVCMQSMLAQNLFARLEVACAWSFTT
eukprot:2489415-Rhodomonas_salina.1